MKQKILQMMIAALVCAGANAQVNTGSNGSDGALDFSSISYTTNIVINMADHPNGIYQYTSVNIPTNVTVSFIPNANNTPVYWLVQNSVVINGIINVSGQPNNGTQGGAGGPGGWAGGNGQNGSFLATDGYGPGGGIAYGYTSGNYGEASSGPAPPPSYGNLFLIPLLGGSGGSGDGGNNTAVSYSGGGGGGGAILIAAGNSINIGGQIVSNGATPSGSGRGSGGGIRLISSAIDGKGTVSCAGQICRGRVRFDAYNVSFSGLVQGIFSQGSQFIIIPTSGQLPQLTVTSVGGVAVSASPTGVLSTPDAVISAQQSSPMPVVVNCANLPLGSAITVTIKPMTGFAVSAVGANNTGTLASSTATISINIPRGGGLIYATAATGN